MKGRCLLWLMLILPIFGMAQGEYQSGLLPSINLNKKLEKGWRLNFRVESRQELRAGEFREEPPFKYDYVLTDYSLISSKKLGLNANLAAGYLLRFRDGEQVHRSIQQYVITRRLAGFRLAHRIATDQTFFRDSGPELRLRYRLTSEFALSGQAVDRKEAYVKINQEVLNSLQEGEYDLELRLVPLLGFQFNDRNKLEAGVDYRINSYLESAPSHRFWLSLNWFLVL